MKTTSEPSFHIGSLPVFGRLILAPMDGISDPTFRWITRRLGSALSVSEFINTYDYTSMRRYQENRLRFREEERPFAFQLLDNSPERMALSAAKLEAEFHPDFFDINLGCSTQRVRSRGAGCGLMRQPELVKEILQQVGAAVSVPVTVKMRLGWDEQELNYHELALLAVENGAQLVALHGRTGRASYQTKARWSAIKELKSLLPVPVIGNGDVKTIKDAKRMLEETGCDAVMIGRAAKANPWLFSWKNREEVPILSVYQLIRYQYAEMARTYPPGKAIMAFRKYLKAYLEPYQLDPAILKTLLTTSEESPLLSQIQTVFLDLGLSPAQLETVSLTELEPLNPVSC